MSLVVCFFLHRFVASHVCASNSNCSYEGRCGLPTNFDSTYCYALGYAAGALLHSGKTGLISSVCASITFSFRIILMLLHKTSIHFSLMLPRPTIMACEQCLRCLMKDGCCCFLVFNFTSKLLASLTEAR